MDTNLKVGFIGGTFFTALVNITLHNVVFTVVMSVIGAMVSFFVSYLLKKFLKRFKL